LREALRARGVRYREVAIDRSGLNPPRDLSTLLRLTALLRSERPDLVISYTVKPVMYGSIAARMVGIRSLSLITGLGSLFISSALLPRAARPLVHGLYRSALAANAAVVFQNPDDRAYFIDYGIVDERRCHQVGGSGVNLERFGPVPVPADPIRFLLIARLLVDKGVREYAAALRILRQQGHRFEADLVGPLEQHPRSIRRAELAGWREEELLTWHGEQSDVRPFLGRCSVYVLPSYREGTPRSVLEAMATGRAVVTTDAPGCRETVAEGQNGYLVPAGDAGALARALAEFLNRPGLAETMGAASLAMVRDRFDVRKVNRQLLEIIDEALDASPASDRPG
jgi:glycosyltransferase involved in cell wall biosynthesis